MTKKYLMLMFRFLQKNVYQFAIALKIDIKKSVSKSLECLSEMRETLRVIIGTDCARRRLSFLALSFVHCCSNGEKFSILHACNTYTNVNEMREEC